MRAPPELCGLLCLLPLLRDDVEWRQPHRAGRAVRRRARGHVPAAAAADPQGRRIRALARAVLPLLELEPDRGDRVGAALDGGAHSALALAFFLPLAFSALSYPMKVMIAVTLLDVGAFIAVARSRATRRSPSSSCSPARSPRLAGCQRPSRTSTRST